MKNKIRILSILMAFTIVLTACTTNTLMKFTNEIKVSLQRNLEVSKTDVKVEEEVITEREDSPDWIANLAEEQEADQIFVVAGVGNTTAYISMHEKDSNGNWKEIMTSPGYIGKYGLGKTKEGDGMTPIGIFHFTKAFGIADNPGCTIGYQKVTDDDWWSGDSNYHYNEMVKLSDYPELSQDDSEHIIDYTYQYQYCLNISYNEEGKAGLGSAIFLHCFGPYKPYTGGCVSLPKQDMITVMKNVKPNCVVVIDSLKELSPETYEDWGL